MNKTIKWLLITVGVLVILVVAVLITIPMFVDIQKYKPDIEQKVSEITGRPFTIGGDINLSFFPWVGISLSDLHLGNPPGFQEKDLLSVKFFEVRVKVIPLISKKIHVKRFILESPRIILEKNKMGQANWEGIGKPSKTDEETTETMPGGILPIAGLEAGEIAITKGTLLSIDSRKGERNEISELTLRLKDVSLDRPVLLAFSANLNGYPFELKGTAGPVGKVPGIGSVSVDLTVKALKELVMDIKGTIRDPATNQEFDLTVQVSPFSPRKLITALGRDIPISAADPKVLTLLAFKARLKGNPKNLSVSDGSLELDDSNLSFSADIKDFSRPNATFDLNLDKIDLDRYLPPPSEKKPVEKQERSKAPSPKTKKSDYTPLRKLVLDGKIRVKELKAHGARIQDLYVKVSSRKGLFRLDPLTLRLYQGDISSKGIFDVRRDIPKSKMVVQAKEIQANPLLNDLLNKDFLEGTLKATLDITMTGDDEKSIKRTLNGKGDFLFNDGAIRGIDLAGMVRNAAAAFGLAEEGGEKPRTDFSKLHAPFTITKGVVDTAKTILTSPILRIHLAGKADLNKETLDFRVEPKFVGTLKGQGDTKERAGITIPVLITGSFSSPEFRPDLKGMLQQKLEKELPEASDLIKMLPGQSSQKGEESSIDKGVKDLLKGFPALD